MNYKKLRSWLLIGVVSSVAALFIGTTVTSCAKNLNNITNTPGNNEPVSPPEPEDNNDHNKPDTTKPSISNINIELDKNSKKLLLSYIKLHKGSGHLSLNIIIFWNWKSREIFN